MTPADIRTLRNTWRAMCARCLNANAPRFHRYGGRGITVCPEWANSFDAFAAYIKVFLGPRPLGMSLDRIDNDKGYEIGNVRWADSKTQRRNSTTAKVSEQDVRLLLRMVHEEGYEVHLLDVVFPLSLTQLRSIALGKSYRLEGYEYPAKLPRRSDAYQFRGGKQPKITPDIVRDIRRRYAEGERVKAIAALYSISTSNAYNVARLHTWRSVS